MINWFFYPRSNKPTSMAYEVVKVFKKSADVINSSDHKFVSNEVLSKIRKGLQKLNFEVETGKKAIQKIHVPVLFGKNGNPEKSFEADAYNEEEGFVIEVEAGRGVTNYQFLKDLFQACMMHDVHYLAIAIRNQYRTSNDFDKVCRFFDTLYASNRLILPLKGILIIGY